MNQDTPAITIKAKDLQLNIEAFEELLTEVKKPKLVLDIRYGLGGWARKLKEKFPTAKLIGFEQDKATFEESCKLLKLNLDTKLQTDNFLVYNERFSEHTFKVDLNVKVDLLLADFNTTTLLKRELLDEAVSVVNPKQLIFTDVSCSKLHLNYKAYGLQKPSLEDYWNSFEITNYRLVKYVKKHFAASSALYVRECK